MSEERNVDVNIRAQTAGLTDGLARATHDVENATLLMKQHFGGLATMVERLKVPFVALGAILAGGELFKDIIGSTADLAEELEKAHQKTGVSVTELSRLKYAAEASHISFETLTHGLQRLALAQEAARQGTGTAERAFQALGLQVANADGSLRNADQLLPALAAKFGTMAAGTQRTALAMQLFGRSGAEMLPMLSKGADGIRELETEADLLGFTMDDKGVHSAESYKNEMVRLHAALEGVGHILAQTMLPALLDLVELATDCVVIMRKTVEWTILLKDALDMRKAHGSWTEWWQNVKGAFATIRDDGAATGKAMDAMWARIRGMTDTGGGAGSESSAAAEAAKKLAIEAEKDKQLALIALEKDAIAYRRETNQITADDEVAQLRDVLGREYAIKFNALNAERALYAGNAREQARVDVEMARTSGQMALEWQKQQEKAATEYIRTWQHVADSVSNSFSSSFETLIDHTGKLRDVILKLGESLEHWLIESGFRQLTQHILIERAKTAATAEGSGQRTAISALAATKSLAIDIAAGLKSIAVESVKAIARAWASISAIPFVGPFLAPGIALATGASILALGGRIASASGGYDIPAGINPMTQLHAQEMVLPADLANVIRGMARGGGGMGGGAPVTVYAMDAQSFVDFAKRNPRGMAAGVKAAQQAGHLPLPG